jgi:hypothetical protein
LNIDGAERYLSSMKTRAYHPRKTTGLTGGCSGLGPYSRAIDRGAIGCLVDGRSTEGRFLRKYEAMLIEHIGGNPSILQRALITRCARLALHLEMIDRKSLAEGRTITQHDATFYASWSNSLGRMLARLGLEPAAAPQPTLADYFASGKFGSAA